MQRARLCVAMATSVLAARVRRSVTRQVARAHLAALLECEAAQPATMSLNKQQLSDSLFVWVRYNPVPVTSADIKPCPSVLTDSDVT